MSAVVFLGLILAALVGAPIGFVYWIRAPRGQLLRRSLVVAALAVLWVLLFLFVVQGVLSALVTAVVGYGGIGGSDY